MQQFHHTDDEGIGDMTEHPPEYTRLTLGGYQTFAEITEMPLSRLTLLFGPNSAGKSAVEEGFRAFADIVDEKQELAITGMMGFDRVGRHFRRVSDSPKEYAATLTLGLGANISQVTLFREAFGDCEYLSGQTPHAIEYTAHFDRTNGEPCDDLYVTVGHKAKFGLNDIPILELHMQDRAGLNLGHPLFKSLDLLQQEVSVPADMADIVRRDGSWLWIEGRFQAGRDGRLRLFNFQEGDEIARIESSRAIYPDFLPTVESLLRLYTKLFNVDFSLVNASRVVPTPAELTFWISSASGWPKADPVLKSFSIPDTGDEQYRLLAEALLSETITVPFDFHEDEEVSASTINRMMRERLFTERGYHLAADYALLLSRSQADAVQAASEDLSLDECAAVVRVSVVDAQGRSFGFPDVGSGLGYVLPVLVSLFGPNKVSMIQQPELHLHPALQGAVGDVLIEACNIGKQVIVETHSEHILLRLLRRIRETAAGTCADPRLRLSPKDISILYFDPSPDGTTTVVPIRVSDDGDFLDRWPRGFFTERDADLFDE